MIDRVEMTYLNEFEVWLDMHICSACSKAYS